LWPRCGPQSHVLPDIFISRGVGRIVSKPVQFQEWPESLSVAYGPYRAVDGDTVHVMVSLGVDEYAYRMVRIRDVNAPEVFSDPPEERERGKAARDFLAHSRNSSRREPDAG
jgi:hypothetical protein